MIKKRVKKLKIELVEEIEKEFEMFLEKLEKFNWVDTVSLETNEKFKFFNFFTKNDFFPLKSIKKEKKMENCSNSIKNVDFLTFLLENQNLMNEAKPFNVSFDSESKEGEIKMYLEDNELIFKNEKKEIVFCKELKRNLSRCRVKINENSKFSFFASFSIDFDFVHSFSFFLFGDSSELERLKEKLKETFTKTVAKNKNETVLSFKFKLKSFRRERFRGEEEFVINIYLGDKVEKLKFSNGFLPIRNRCLNKSFFSKSLSLEDVNKNKMVLEFEDILVRDFVFNYIRNSVRHFEGSISKQKIKLCFLTDFNPNCINKNVDVYICILPIDREEDKIKMIRNNIGSEFNEVKHSSTNKKLIFYIFVHNCFKNDIFDIAQIMVGNTCVLSVTILNERLLMFYKETESFTKFQSDYVEAINKIKLNEDLTDYEIEHFFDHVFWIVNFISENSNDEHNKALNSAFFNNIIFEGFYKEKVNLYNKTVNIFWRKINEKSIMFKNGTKMRNKEQNRFVLNLYRRDYPLNFDFVHEKHFQTKTNPFFVKISNFKLTFNRLRESHINLFYDKSLFVLFMHFEAKSCYLSDPKQSRLDSHSIFSWDFDKHAILNLNCLDKMYLSESSIRVIVGDYEGEIIGYTKIRVGLDSFKKSGSFFKEKVFLLGKCIAIMKGNIFIK